VKVYITEDEWYPVLELAREKDASDYVRRFDPLAEIDVKLWHRYQRALKEFEAVQAELRAVQDALPKRSAPHHLLGTATSAVYTTWVPQ
jgi:hypothetical protein